MFGYIKKPRNSDELRELIKSLPDDVNYIGFNSNITDFCINLMESEIKTMPNVVADVEARYIIKKTEKYFSKYLKPLSHEKDAQNITKKPSKRK